VTTMSLHTMSVILFPAKLVWMRFQDDGAVL